MEIQDLSNLQPLRGFSYRTVQREASIQRLGAAAVLAELTEAVQRVSTKITVSDKHSKTIKAVVVIEGDFTLISKKLAVTLEVLLREFSGDTITINEIEEGSIRLIIEGSEEDVNLLISRISSRELTELNSLPILDIHILSKSPDDKESHALDNKWSKVQEIISQGANGQDLSGVDLSDADLSETNLECTNLSNADLSGTDLSRTNLKGANLSNADLTDSDLHGTNLTGSNLTDADLRGANLRGITINEVTIIDRKWRRVWEIVNQSVIGRFLREADLSGADLYAAELREADLSSADLSHASLSHANLISADLSSADLGGANLSGANLKDADLKEAQVKNTDFGIGRGLSEITKNDLKRRGAIFQDSSGDRSLVSH